MWMIDRMTSCLKDISPHPTKSLSTQEEIDALGGGKTIRDWENRFELAYEKCRDENVTLVGGVPGINTHYRPALHALYGKVAIREIYGATECMFGQQRDEKKAWVPNYDLFFFEVETWPERGRRAGSGIKMLHEMRPGEMGSMIVSTLLETQRLLLRSRRQSGLWL
jgi:hypothetical protein